MEKAGVVDCCWNRFAVAIAGDAGAAAPNVGLFSLVALLPKANVDRFSSGPLAVVAELTSTFSSTLMAAPGAGDGLTVSVTSFDTLLAADDDGVEPKLNWNPPEGAVGFAAFASDPNALVATLGVAAAAFDATLPNENEFVDDDVNALLVV